MIQLRTRSDPDLAKLLVFLVRLSKRAYAGAAIDSHSTVVHKEAGTLDRKTIEAMLANYDTRCEIAKARGAPAPSLRETVSDRSFKRDFPVIGGKSRQPGQVTEDTARKAMARGRRLRAATAV